MLELPGWVEDVTAGMRRGEQARIAADLPMRLAISDERLAIIPLLPAGDSMVTRWSRCSRRCGSAACRSG
ncbi:hypothetical protein ACQEVF_50380 [Nonomuraea polychroma]|uniref:hypothetical protein n=1 Tax=Nonomuraea polychroma TaxID=46176 RepID=UPI003D8A137C